MDSNPTAPAGDQKPTAIPAQSPAQHPPPAAETAQPAQPAQTTAPAPATKEDEEESDLDELDDVLDDFSASAPAKADLSESAIKKPEDKPDLSQLPSPDEEALMRQLEAGMAELLGGGGGNDTTDDWNNLANELTKHGLKSGDLMNLIMGEDMTSTGGEASGDAARKTEDKFQETIQKTMERMQESGDKATAAANTNSEDEMLANLLKAMESAGMGGGDGTEEDFEQLLMGVMEQLSNKEMLYEPVKELSQKFEPWLKDNKDKLSKEEYERYVKQSGLMSDVLKKFDEPGYSDDNHEHRTYVWEKMQAMQSTGAPPKELVSDPLTEELFSGGGDMSQCPQQ
ncbi:Peroxisome chaperone and import receptor [Ophidiomyces ophidiicola]|nr:Peroxisome chaperone and import receptor [Ophidiomyces ophidiicola]KAI1976731.1 Peroxisome chaperone and import receptor [Ophidiomyces ophidiicola]KAI1978115.1 Peroxisome chaperone and import receptor [Ophidiomyces ophidiicola]KAI1985944.1 Peroxisome chaperone and import receptor [Ophidiomyces ophidiicola]KAI1998804.1 Peroxisome chaperone and import receptor [Ophidiomyces ophidiicola]